MEMEMDTPLAVQLQQAWLHTQMRTNNKQPPSPSPAPAPCPAAPLHPSPSPPSSSWAPASDPSWLSAASNSSLPLDPSQDEPPLRDPVLQYINDMLMDEDIEDRKCMMLECMSYHATVKSFYDILEGADGPSNADSLHPCSQKPEPEQQQQQSPELSLEEYRWVDDLLGMGETPAVAATGGAIPVQMQGSDLSPPWSSDSSGSTLHSPQQSHDTSSQSSSTGVPQPDPFFIFPSPSPAVETPLSSSVPLDFSFHDHKDTGAEFTQPQVLDSGGKALGNEQNKPFTRSISEDLEVSTDKLTSPSSGRSKRAALQRDWDSDGQQRPRSNAFHASVQVSSEVPSKAERDEVLSYVRNKSLNAERYAKMLQDLPFSCEDAVHRFSPRGIVSAAVQAGGAGKGSAVIVDLQGLLVSCAQAVAADDLRNAHQILQDIRRDASPYGNGLQRLAHYFAEGLVARLSGTGARLFSAITNNAPSAAKMLQAHHLFVEVCPFVKVCHYFANKAILEAAEGASRLHIVDYGILYGLQWPCLISALAERKGGPPVLRITGIDFPQPGFKSAERVEMTGRRLSEYAKTYAVPFEYHAVASKWELVQPSSLHLRKDEVLVVNSMCRLRHLLDETVMASNPRKTVLNRIRSMNPKLFVEGIKNGSLNAPFFMARFREALSFYSNKFDMMETVVKSDNQERMMIEREVLGRDILNIVACEGPERVERPETYRQWQNRTQRAGFEQLPLDQKVFDKAREIVRSSYHKDFGVEADGQWMLLDWKGQVLHALSLWRPAPSSGN